MPLTEFQRQLAQLLSVNRTPDSHLAGGAALHFEPNSKRYSNDLDYFHDSVERVASAFRDDERLLTAEGYSVAVEMNQPGYIRAQLEKDGAATKIEWAHDSDWRFMPVIANAGCGYQLHPIDLAINKVLALAGRDEPRDFLDVLHVDREVLSLGALCWAAAGKDPGFTPLSLLELLKRRGKYRPQDFQRLRLVEPPNPLALKTEWLDALERAEGFIRRRPAHELGCLYYSVAQQKFVTPSGAEAVDGDAGIVLHYGRPGGVLPRLPPAPAAE